MKPARETTVIASDEPCLRFVICRRAAAYGCRGLCRSDYTQIREMISDRLYTDDQLVAMGRLLPKRSSVKDWVRSGEAALKGAA